MKLLPKKIESHAPGWWNTLSESEKTLCVFLLQAKRGIFFDEVPTIVSTTQANPDKSATEGPSGHPYENPNKVHPYVRQLIEQSFQQPIVRDEPENLQSYAAVFLKPELIQRHLPNYWPWAEDPKELVKSTRLTVREFFEVEGKRPVQVSQVTEELYRARPNSKVWKLLASIQNSNGEGVKVRFNPAFTYAWFWLAAEQCLRRMRLYYALEEVCTKDVEIKRRKKGRINRAARILIPFLRGEVANQVQNDIRWLKASLDSWAISPEIIRKVRRACGIQRLEKTDSKKHAFWNPIIHGLIDDLSKAIPHKDLGPHTKTTPEKAYEVVAKLLSHLWPKIWRWQPDLPAVIKVRYFYQLS